MIRQRNIEINIPIPEPEVPLKNEICSNCQIRDHRIDVNKDNQSAQKETKLKFGG